MKAFSVYPPYGMFIVNGNKGIETRSWRTTLRGRFAIHHTKYVPSFVETLRTTNPAFAFACDSIRQSHFYGPPGCVIGTAELVDCVQMTEENIGKLNPIERAIGDYAPGRWMWILANPVKFEVPVPAIGKQGIWEWSPR